MSDARVPPPDTDHPYPCDRCGNIHRLYQRDGQLLCPDCCGGRIAIAHRAQARRETT